MEGRGVREAAGDVEHTVSTRRWLSRGCQDRSSKRRILVGMDSKKKTFGLAMRPLLHRLVGE